MKFRPYVPNPFRGGRGVFRVGRGVFRGVGGVVGTFGRNFTSAYLQTQEELGAHLSV